MGLTFLYDVADTLLTEALLGLDETRTGRPAPETAFVAHGEAPWPTGDAEGCLDRLTVHLDPSEGITHRLLRSEAGMPAHQCSLVPDAKLVLTYLRCVPTMDDQGEWDPDVYDESAQVLMEQAWALLTWLYRRWSRRELIPGASCGDIAFDPALPLPPDGGVAGWQIPVYVKLNDPGPDPGGAS